MLVIAHKVAKTKG